MVSHPTSCAQVYLCKCKSLPGNLLHQIPDRIAWLLSFPFFFFFSPSFFFFFFQSGNTVAEWFRSSVSVKVKHFPLVRGGGKNR